MRLAVILIWCSLAACVGGWVAALNAEISFLNSGLPVYELSLIKPAVLGTAGALGCLAWFALTRYDWPLELAKYIVVYPLVAVCCLYASYGLYGQFYVSQVIPGADQSARAQFKQTAEYFCFHSCVHYYGCRQDSSVAVR